MKSAKAFLANHMRGFTVFEILIVMGIFTIMVGIAAPTQLGFYLNYQFDSETDLLTALLHQARNLSMVNYNEASHGLYVLSDQFVVFEGDSYAARVQANDKKYPRNTDVAVSGATEIVFTSLSGATASTTFNLNDTRKSRDIFVNPEGLIYE